MTQDEICKAIQRNNMRVSREWEELLSSNGHVDGFHEDAINLAEVQGKRESEFNKRHGVIPQLQT